MSAVLTPQLEIGVVPPNSRGLLPSITHAAWWPLHDGTGTTLAEKLGLGAPDLGLVGTPGSEWGDWGWLAPNGSDHRAETTPGNAYMESLCNLRTLVGGELLAGFEMTFDGDATATEAILNWGRNLSSGGGQWCIQLTSAEIFNAFFHGGVGGAAVNVNFSAFPFTADTTHMRVVFKMKVVSTTQLDVEAHLWRNGALQPPIQVLNVTADNLVPATSASERFAVGARGNSTALWDRPLGAAAGSNAKVNNVWLARVSTQDTGLAEAALLSMAASPRDFPVALRA